MAPLAPYRAPTPFVSESYPATGCRPPTCPTPTPTPASSDKKMGCHSVEGLHNCCPIHRREAQLARSSRRAGSQLRDGTKPRILDLRPGFFSHSVRP